MDLSNDDDMGLTSEQTEKMLQFQYLTGIEDLSTCRDILQRHQWDLEVAIQEQLNIREGRPSVFTTTETRPQAVDTDRSDQRIFSTPASPDPPVGIRGLFGYVLNVVVSLFYNTFSSVLTTILSIFREEPRRIITDPLTDVMGFITRYREQFGAKPVFYQGTYSQAVNDAKRQLRFLLVYLHSDNHTDAATFCRNTLSDEQVSEYISLHTLLWGCNIQSPEGWRVSHSLAVCRYPVCAVIALRDHRMTVVGRIEGDTDKDLFLQRLDSLLSNNEIYLSQERADRYERSLTQTLRAQQDEAYEQSLRADQEKEKLREEERQLQKTKENEERQLQQDEQLRKDNIAQEKIECLAKIPEEPAADVPGVLSIVIKLPCGTRLERRFLSSHSVEDLFYYVFSHPSAPDVFEITTNFPKRVLQIERGGRSMTLAQAGLQNREVLFINDLDA